MAFTPQVNPKDAVFVQRSDTNTKYEQINISGSDAIIYLDENGHVMADKISDWASKYGIGTGGSSLSSSWASSSLTASYVPYDGDRAIKRSPYSGINVGGEHVVEFLDNFFFPFIAATVSITTPSSTIYYETGSVQTQTITSTITANDETSFGTGSVKRSGEDWNTIASIPPYTPSFTDTNISSSHTYRTSVQVDNDGSPTVINSATRTVSFVFPYLYGLSTTAGLEGTALYSAMVSKSLTNEQDKGDYFWGTGTYIYFCYPSSYSDLSSILDPSNLELLPSFEHSSSVSITSVGLTNDWTENYHVYRLKLLANPQGYFQFYH